MEGIRYTNRLAMGSYLLLVLGGAAVLLVAWQVASWVPLVALAPLLLVAFAVALLQASAIRRREREEIWKRVQQLGRELLDAPLDGSGIAELLGEGVPALFPGAQVVVWLGDALILLDDESITSLPLAELNTRLAADTAGYCFWSAEEGIPEALVVAIGQPPAGGIYLAPPSDNPPVRYLPHARALAQLLSSAIQRTERHQEALAELAQEYEEAVFNEAYRAELYAQTMTYQRIEQELALAWRIQASFLPHELPELEGWQLSALLEPARQMSGDFYDFIHLPEGNLGLVVADVADKGLGPALFMALCRTLVRTYAEDFLDQPHHVLGLTNRRILAETTSDLFITLFYGVLNLQSGEFRFANAGHNPPLLIRQGNPQHSPDVDWLPRTCLPLGILEDLQEEEVENRVVLQPGDVLALYTDGITEAQDEDEAFFGEERLVALLESNHERSAQVIGDKLIAAVYEYMGDAPQHDDMTLMVVRRQPESAPPTSDA